MKLAKLFEMPLKRISIDPHATLTNFSAVDVKAAQKQIANGNYELKLKNLPFNFYVIITGSKPAGHGQSDDEIFEAIRAEDSEAVVFFLSDNGSPDEVTLTPWMIVHRFFQDSCVLVGPPTFWNNSPHGKMADGSTGPKGKLLFDTIKAGYEFNSARSDRLAKNEYMNEFAVDIAVTGKVRFNYDRAIEAYQGSLSPEQLRKILEERVQEFKNGFDRLIAAIKSYDKPFAGNFNEIYGLDFFK